MKRILLLIALVFSLAAIAFTQTHFVPVFPGYGVDHMNFYAMTATIDGVALQAGDEVAVFDATYCVGVAVVVTPGVMLSVPASKDDPITVGVVDGYRTGNTATFKMWDASSGTEITDIDITLVGGTLTFDVGTSTFVNLAGTSPAQQNTPPVISYIGNRSVAEGNPFSGIALDSYVTDAETADENIVWTFSGHTNLSVTVTSRIAWITPLDVNWNGSETITFTATDDDPTNPLSDTEDVLFTVTPVNDPPVFTTSPILSATEGVLYSYTVLASDVDLDALTYDAVTLPPWLNFNPTTRVLSGTPGSSDGGSSFNVSLRVTDSHVFVTQDFQITVAESSNKLVFTTPAQTLYTGFPSQIITLELQDGANNPVNVVSNTTVQLTTSSATGTFSGNRDTWVNITTVTIPAGSHAVSFYYKDNTAGSPMITAAESPDLGWTNAMQTLTIEQSTLSHVMHHVVGTVRTSADAIPANGQLSFSAYIISRPGEILNESSTRMWLRGWLLVDTMCLLPYWLGSG